MTTFHPYVFFAGFCREAFTFYQEVFGGELTIVTNADMPENERMPGAGDDVVMHAALTFDDGGLLLGSDDPSADEPRPAVGVSINVELASVDETTRVFEALSKDGSVAAPLEPASFTPMFGMVTDRFGLSWLLTTAFEQQ